MSVMSGFVNIMSEHAILRRSMLQCIRCGVLQCVCCSVLQYAAVCEGQCVAVFSLWCVCCSVCVCV